MAINASELAVIKSLIDDRKRHGGAVHVVSFGYPDLLMTAENVVKIFGDEQAKTLPRRDDSFRVAVDHGFRMDLAEGVFESFALFKALGAQLTVIDIISWTGCEYMADLNFPIDAALKNKFDVVIDPGGLEHVFNVAQAFKNTAEMTKVGGYIVHSNPMSHINHGFYSFSPTLYADFYELNGFKTHWIRRRVAGPVADGYEFGFEDVDRLAVMNVSQIALALALVQKIEDRPVRWPIQGIYGGGASTPRPFQKPLRADLDEGFSFAETSFKWMTQEASPRWRDLADQIVKDGLQACAIYGASRLSELAIQYFQERNIKATCIIDREAKIWGYDIRGVPIVSLKTALQNGETNFYIATERFQEEITSTLISAEPEPGAFRIFSWG